MGGHLDHLSGPAVAVILYLAFLSRRWRNIRYGQYCLTHNDVSKVAIFGFVNPLFSVILSAIVLGSAAGVSDRSLIALILVCVGLCGERAGKSGRMRQKQ